MLGASQVRSDEAQGGICISHFSFDCYELNRFGESTFAFLTNSTNVQQQVFLFYVFPISI